MARLLALAIVGAVLLVGAGDVWAEGMQIVGLESAELRISGNVRPSSALLSVAAIGDVNGDGYGDIAIGTQGDTARLGTATYAYVIFMTPLLRAVDLNGLGDHGFRIFVPPGGDDGAALEVARAGDVNGDGLDDIAVGDLKADPNGRPGAGAAYVVFGKRSRGDVDVNALGDDGFSILGDASVVSAGNLGRSVAGIGDMNGDGLDDIAVTEPGTDRIWVVKGAASTATVDLEAPQGRAFILASGRSLGNVAAVGDVNGDGVPDVAYMLFAVQGGPNNEIDVVFGSARDAPAGGFRIIAPLPDRGTGVLAPAGDVNGDGRADVLVSASSARHGPFTGAVYVVFGKPSASAVELGALGSDGYRIDGAAAGDELGGSLASAGDVNGDGRADVVVGSQASNNGRHRSGSVYVVPGKADAQPVDLAEPGAAFLRIDGAVANDLSGLSLAAGDLNGDAISDYVVGTPTSGFYGNWSVSVVFARPGGRADTVAPTTTDDADAAWHNAAVTVHLAAADNEGGSGVAATYYSLDAGPQRQGMNVLVAAPADHTNDGVHTIAYRSVDNAGNGEAARVATVKIDTTAPSIVAIPMPAPNTSGWNNSAVTVSFSCSDSGSGIASCPANSLVGEGAGQSVTGVASDRAGNTASATLADINVDTNAPVVSYSGNAGSYAVDQTVAISCTATDALSGVASSTCADITGPAYAFGLGTIMRSATATDLAGNTGNASTSFTVTVDSTSLCSLARRFSARTDVAASLCAKITSIASAPNADAKSGKLAAFDNQLAAQTGKALTAAQAAVLRQLAASL
jgi:FG-GAP-like repeat/FG-GAP repeat